MGKKRTLYILPLRQVKRCLWLQARLLWQVVLLVQALLPQPQPRVCARAAVGTAGTPCPAPAWISLLGIIRNQSRGVGCQHGDLSSNKSQSLQDHIACESILICGKDFLVLFSVQNRWAGIAVCQVTRRPPARRRCVITGDPRARRLPRGLRRERALLKQHTLLASTAGKSGLASLQTLPTSGCCCRHIRIS